MQNVVVDVSPTEDDVSGAHIAKKRKLGGAKSYEEGVRTTTKTQQLIAFWIHTMDIYTTLTETGHDLVPTAWYEDDIPNTVFADTGTETPNAFLGAIREGYKQAISTLPDDVRGPVEAYVRSQLATLNTEDDPIFGNRPPDETSSDED